MKVRIGFGFDVHKLVEGRDLWMGGVKIPHSLGLLGHSDADVLIHAICDAILGAANMRDIGFHFPDTAGEYKDIDSKILLKKTVALVCEKGYEIGNIDATICAERPKMNPHIPEMQPPKSVTIPPPRFTISEWRVPPPLPNAVHTCTRVSMVLWVSVAPITMACASAMQGRSLMIGKQRRWVISSVSTKSLS